MAETVAFGGLVLSLGVALFCKSHDLEWEFAVAMAILWPLLLVLALLCIALVAVVMVVAFLCMVPVEIARAVFGRAGGVSR